MNKKISEIGIEVIKNLTELVITIDQREEERSKKEDIRHKELIEAIKSLKTDGTELSTNVEALREIHVDKKEDEIKIEKTETHKINKEKKAKKTEIKKEEEINLFAQATEEIKEEKTVVEMIAEKIEEAKEIKEEDINTEIFGEDVEDVISTEEQLGADSSNTYAIIDEEKADEAKEYIDELINEEESQETEQKEEVVEEEQEIENVVEEDKEIEEILTEDVKEDSEEEDSEMFEDEDDEDEVLAMLNKATERINLADKKEKDVKIEEEEENTEKKVVEPKEKTEIEEATLVGKSSEEIKQEIEELRAEIHSFNRLKNDYPIIDDELLKIMLEGPLTKAPITKKIMANKILAELQKAKDEMKMEEENQLINNHGKKELESISVMEEIQELEVEKDEIRVEGDLTEEVKELILEIDKGRKTEPFVHFHGEIKLLKDQFIEFGGETLYKTEYMKEIVVNVLGKEVTIKKGTEGGYVSEDCFIGRNVGIWPKVRVFSGAVIADNSVIATAKNTNEEIMIGRFQKITEKGTIIWKDKSILETLDKTEFKIVRD